MYSTGVQYVLLFYGVTGCVTHSEYWFKVSFGVNACAKYLQYWFQYVALAVGVICCVTHGADLQYVVL